MSIPVISPSVPPAAPEAGYGARRDTSAPAGRRRAPRAAGFGAGAAAVSTAALLALAMAAPAAAHDQLLSSTPEAGTTILDAPSELSLMFSGNLITGQGIQNVATVTDEDGHQWQDGEAEVSGPELSAALCEDMPNGEYEVSYRVVYSDGHSEEKAYDFTLEDPTAPESGVPEDCGVPNLDAPASSNPTAADAGSATAATEPATEPASDPAVSQSTGEATAEDSQAPAAPVPGWVWPAAIGGVLVVAVAAVMVFRKAKAIDTGSTGNNSPGPDGEADDR